MMKLKTSMNLLGVVGIAFLVFISIASLTDCGIYNGISFDHQVEGVNIRTSYQSDYGESQWKITDNKELYIKLEIVQQPNDTEVLIEHMHADVSIHAYKPHVDGLLQDTMDDKMHTGTQAGFYVSETYPYYETFAVEGYSKFLIEGWGFLIGYYGWTKIQEKRLTESNLIKVGAQGSEVVIVYDVLIKNPNETMYHKYIITDNFYIFFNGQFEPSSQVEEQKTTRTIIKPEEWAIWAYILACIVFIAGIVLGYIHKSWTIFSVFTMIALIIFLIAALGGTQWKEIVVVE